MFIAASGKAFLLQTNFNKVLRKTQTFSLLIFREVLSNPDFSKVQNDFYKI